MNQLFLAPIKTERPSEPSYALFNIPPAAGGCPEQGIEEEPLVDEKGPEQMRHGKRDVMPVAVGEDMRLLRNPLLGGFEAAGAAGF